MSKRYSTLYSTLDKYEKVTKERPKPADHEIRIASERFNMAATILKAAKYLIEGKGEFIQIQAIGNAIHKGALLSEIIRHRVPGLHQICRITQTEIEDQYIPTEEGLDTIIDKKALTVLEITLTYNPSAQDKREVGYQLPLPINQVDEIDLNNPEEKDRTKRKRNRRRRNGRGEEYYEEDYDEEYEEEEEKKNTGGNRRRTGKSQGPRQEQGQEQRQRQGESQGVRQRQGQSQGRQQGQGQGQAQRQGQSQRQGEGSRQGQRRNDNQRQGQGRSQSQKRFEEQKVSQNESRGGGRRTREYHVKDQPEQARSRSANPKGRGNERTGGRLAKEYVPKGAENGNGEIKEKREQRPASSRNDRSKSQGIVKKYQVKQEEGENNNRGGWVNVEDGQKGTEEKRNGEQAASKGNQGGGRRKGGAGRNFGYY